MKTKLLLAGCLISSAFLVTGQTTINKKVSSALDDHEERISGANPQNGTVGNMYVASTALDLGNETATTNPILVGLRFTNITIPKYATIMNAYIQFTVKGTAKNADPCNLNIYAENNANPATFSDNANSLSGRTLAAGSVAWSVSGASWGTVGSATNDQRTSDIKSLITPLVFNSNWAPGNAMAFFIKGTGVREVEAFESDPAKAAELVVTYSVAGGTSTLTTGIEEQAAHNAVNVYPNPFKGSFNTRIELAAPSDINISVFDITGKLVEEKIVKHANAGSFEYTSASALRPGMYFVKVQANGKEETIKLISE